MAAATAWSPYNNFKFLLGKKALELSASGDTFKMALYLSTSNLADDALSDANARYGVVSNEHANANGYTPGGVTCVPTWTEAAGVVTFDVADGQWTAAGGNIVCRWAAVYDFTHANKYLVAWTLLDSTPADVTVTDTNTLTVQINASGVFTMSG